MAARFCPHCGKEVSSAARFCPHCGGSLAAGAMPGASAATRVDAAARGTRRLLIPLAVAALVVLVIAVAVLANRLHEESLLASRPMPVAAAPPLTNVPPQPIAAPPLTNTPTQPMPAAQPLTNAPSTAPGQLPPDVAAYVQFLQGIEQRRGALDNKYDYSSINSAIGQVVNAQNQEAQKLNEGDDVPPQDSSNNGSQINPPLKDYEAKFQALIADFRSQSPPQQCTLLANNYYLFLTDDFSSISQLQVGLLNTINKMHSNSSDEPSGSTDVGNLSSGLLKTQAKRDQEGTAADAALSQLCQSYNAPKPFNIQPEGSSSSLLGM